jgi:type IV secretory pathway VirB4 component
LKDRDFSNLHSLKQGRLLEENLREQIELYDRLETLEDDGSIPAEKLQQRLATLQQRKLDYLEYPFLPIKAHAPETSIELGTTRGQPYRIPLNQLTKHVLTIGETGAGKTNLNYLILDQLRHHNTPFLIFDLKQDYRHLLNREGFENDLAVIPWEEFKFNPLQPPPGLNNPRRWTLKFVDIFGHSQHLLDASKSYLLQMLRRTWRKNDEPPTLNELKAEIQRDNTDSYKRQNYRDTVLNRLEMLTYAGETTFNTNHGLPLETLLQNNVVLELDGLNNQAQNLLIETLLVKTFLHRKHTGTRGTGLQHVFLVDEAKKVFSKKKETDNPNELPTVTEAVAQFREFGESIIAADQEATKLTESLMANTSTKILLPTGSHNQFQRMADSIGLDSEQRRYAQRQLKTGRGLIYSRETGMEPVNIPLFDPPDGLKKDVSDERIQAMH